MLIENGGILSICGPKTPIGQYNKRISSILDAQSTNSVIRLQNLDRFYQMGEETIHALDDVSLEIERNEYTAIMGSSGSGKSTLMNVIGCLDSPTGGQYWLNGELVSAMNDRQLARA